MVKSNGKTFPRVFSMATNRLEIDTLVNVEVKMFVDKFTGNVHFHLENIISSWVF